MDIPPEIDYNPSKHGKPIGIQFGCFVFQDAIGRWYCFLNPSGFHKGPQWTFHLNPGFRMDPPAPGISPCSWRAWVARQRDVFVGQPLHREEEKKGQKEGQKEGEKGGQKGGDDGYGEILEEWSEVNSVVVSKMFRVEHPTFIELCYLQQTLEQFARMYPERVVQEEDEEEEAEEGDALGGSKSLRSMAC